MKFVLIANVLLLPILAQGNEDIGTKPSSDLADAKLRGHHMYSQKDQLVDSTLENKSLFRTEEGTSEDTEVTDLREEEEDEKTEDESALSEKEIRALHHDHYSSKKWCYWKKGNKYCKKRHCHHGCYYKCVTCNRHDDYGYYWHDDHHHHWNEDNDRYFGNSNGGNDNGGNDNNRYFGS